MKDPADKAREGALTALTQALSKIKGTKSFGLYTFLDEEARKPIDDDVAATTDLVNVLSAMVPLFTVEVRPDAAQIRDFIKNFRDGWTEHEVPKQHPGSKEFKTFVVALRNCLQATSLTKVVDRLIESCSHFVGKMSFTLMGQSKQYQGIVAQTFLSQYVGEEEGDSQEAKDDQAPRLYQLFQDVTPLIQPGCKLLINTFKHEKHEDAVPDYLSIKQSISQSINQSIDQSISQSVNQPINKAVNQSIN